MKLRQSILIMAACVGTAFQMASCSEELGDSIFDTHQYPLNQSAYTFPLDTFVKVNFLEPYNMRFIYKMEYISSDKEKNLTPASYENSCKLAVLTKYLWYDSYKNMANEHDVFLKKYSPRIIHVIGSKNLNTSSGTETLGVTEGGTKVTLYRVNLLNPADIDNLNEYFFETMHHEFGHILDNTKLHPTPFNLLSNGLYNSAGWSDTPDSVAASQGFVSPYASSSYTEDWVETLACYVTYDQDRWEKLLNTAKYDWEEIDFQVEDYQPRYPRAYREYLNGYALQTQNYDTIGYLRQTANYEYKLVRKVVVRNGDDTVALDSEGNYTIITDADNIDGRATILEKLDLVRNWLKENWGVDLDALRHEVQSRQYVTDAEGNFLRDSRGNFINRLTYVDPANPEAPTLIQQLLQEVEEYKKLQTTK